MPQANRNTLPASSLSHCPSIAIASGKGGVGKTNVVANLAAALAIEGQRVIVLDADFSLSNLDVLLGLCPRYHIGHFFSGEKKLEEILVEGPQGIRILPAASGMENLTAMTREQRDRLVRALDELLSDTDFFLMDTAAGISENVTGLLAASARSIVVTDPDPTSLVDAYALIKVMHHRKPSADMEILVNSVTSELEAHGVFKQIAAATDRFLSHSTQLFGWVARDPHMQRAVRRQRLVVLEFPDSPAAESFRHLAKHLAESSVSGSSRTNLVPFPLRQSE